MEKSSKISALFSCMVLSLLASSSSAQTCRTQTFPNNKKYATCNDLPVLNCSLHWTYDQAARTIDLAFRHVGTNSGRWSAWAINPSGARMVGSQALVAYVNSSSGAAQAFTTQITSYSPSMTPAGLSFPVRNLSATFENNNMMMTIFAVLTNITQNLLNTNQVWQEGPYINGTFGTHPTSGPNVRAATSINFLAGIAPAPSPAI